MTTTSIKRIAKPDTKADQVLIAGKNSKWKALGLAAGEVKAVKRALGNELKFVTLTRNDQYLFVVIADSDQDRPQKQEGWRKLGVRLAQAANQNKLEQLFISADEGAAEALPFIIEGVVLTNYQFNKYKKQPNTNSLKTLKVLSAQLTKADAERLTVMTEAVFAARDLVNEPVIYLTAEQLSKEIQKLSKDAGFKVEVFNKGKIRSLKMGGLLGVNAGSQDPPTFNILEWKSPKAKNKKPIVIVGKGVVYDTGGLSLKPTANSMDKMKSDMSGSAVVVGAIYAAAKAKLPIHVIGLIPATDNRPGEKAITPGDVITMHSGHTVEVMNTDAEGRLILADALSYAKRYKPELVVDFATLTGSAMRAVGTTGTVYMGTADDKVKTLVEDSGQQVYERLVEFPVWEEYDDQLKSDIADMKNIGGPAAGAITAGKFLQRFTDYPWLHFDIAGGAFLDAPDGYRPKGGTGIGVRLMFDFLSKQGK